MSQLNIILNVGNHIAEDLIRKWEQAPLKGTEDLSYYHNTHPEHDNHHRELNPDSYVELSGDDCNGFYLKVNASEEELKLLLEEDDLVELLGDCGLVDENHEPKLDPHELDQMSYREFLDYLT